jgi:hypothetical protein
MPDTRKACEEEDGQMGSAEEPIPASEYRRRETEILFGIELLLYRWELSEFILDEEAQIFRDRDGRAVLSRHCADRKRLFGE